jgi:mono/diheme cytochrome c family protein
MKTQPNSPVSFPEPPEPHAERGFMPVSLIGLLAVVAFLANMYFIYHGLDIEGKGGAFPKLVYFPYTSYGQLGSGSGPGPEGKRVYNLTCSPCHQPTGMGTPGMFPPLAGSEWVLAEGHERIIRIVLNGLSGPIEVAGAQFNNVMVPWRDTLKDEEIAAVLTFVRSEWGNKADAVTPEEVAKVRKETEPRGTPWTADELKQVPEKAQ